MFGGDSCWSGMKQERSSLGKNRFLPSILSSDFFPILFWRHGLSRGFLSVRAVDFLLDLGFSRAEGGWRHGFVGDVFDLMAFCFMVDLEVKLTRGGSMWGVLFLDGVLGVRGGNSSSSDSDSGSSPPGIR